MNNLPVHMIQKLFPLFFLAFLGAACQRHPMTLSAQNGTSEQIAYLEAHIEKTNFGGRMFCRYAQIPLQKNDTLVANTEYWWVTCQEFYRDGGTLHGGTGVSVPVVAHVDPANGNIVSIERPDDAGYTDNITRLFPVAMAKDILSPGYVFSPDLMTIAQQYFDQHPQ